MESLSLKVEFCGESYEYISKSLRDKVSMNSYCEKFTPPKNLRVYVVQIYFSLSKLEYYRMPKPNRRKSRLQSLLTRRWSNTRSETSETSSDEYQMDTDDEESSFNESFSLADIGDLAEMCKEICGIKYTSVLLYSVLRSFNVKWENIDEFFKSIGYMTAQASHKWASTFIKGDFEEFSADLRGGKQIDSFYDIFLDIEVDARAFAVAACLQKSAEFKAMHLAQFIDKKFYESTETQKKPSDDLIIPERSCRLDLRRWGAKFEAKTQRSYFQGHEREDLIKHRNEFIKYFLQHQDSYYKITGGETPMWRVPTKNPRRILICECD